MSLPQRAFERRDRTMPEVADDSGRLLRIAAVGDFHCKGHGESAELAELFARAGAESDILLLLGDMTTHGDPEQVREFLGYIAAVEIPILAILGNHDHENDRAEDVAAMLTDAGVRVLDGEGIEVEGVGFAGAKGFGGGFGRRVLEPWGEPAIKRFVQDALDEALKLERALSRLRTKARIALLHYSPIRGTVEGEPAEIYPFLGSSRLEEPINRFRVDAVFHGHCHHGTAEGRTTGGIPVYNVALPVLRKANGDGAAVRIVEVMADG